MHQRRELIGVDASPWHGSNQKREIERGRLDLAAQTLVVPTLEHPDHRWGDRRHQLAGVTPAMDHRATELRRAAVVVAIPVVGAHQLSPADGERAAIEMSLLALGLWPGAWSQFRRSVASDRHRGWSRRRHFPCQPG